MKCKDCPLFDCYRDSWEYDEYDVRCLADWKCQDFPKNTDIEFGGCRRTNKWILSQDRDELEKKYIEYDCECLEQYMKEQGLVEKVEEV